MGAGWIRTGPRDVGTRRCRNSGTIPWVTLRSAWSLRAGKYPPKACKSAFAARAVGRPELGILRANDLHAVASPRPAVHLRRVVLDHIAACARAWPQVLTNGAPGRSGVPGSATGEIGSPQRPPGLLGRPTALPVQQRAGHARRERRCRAAGNGSGITASGGTLSLVVDP